MLLLDITVTLTYSCIQCRSPR